MSPHDIAKLRLLSIFPTPETVPYRCNTHNFLVHKEDTQLLADINKALAELKADGTIAGIVAKYIKAE